MAIYGNMVGGGSAPLKTLILTDENGNEVVGVVTDSVQAFSATPADVRINKTFVSDNGIETGENTITYRTFKGECLIFPQENFSIPLRNNNHYDYTKFQGIITKFGTSIDDSVYAEKIALNNAVFNVNSTEKMSDITKNATSKSIDLNIINNTNDMYLIHFFTYKEEN